ncbi:hypothetical protein TNCV_3114611 [Trichonephila clavipes]|nr:hypothetical protein TNCV_3114611 [Trichonephila clavipes]
MMRDYEVTPNDDFWRMHRCSLHCVKVFRGNMCVNRFRMQTESSRGKPSSAPKLICHGKPSLASILAKNDRANVSRL